LKISVRRQINELDIVPVGPQAAQDHESRQGDVFTYMLEGLSIVINRVQLRRRYKQYLIAHHAILKLTCHITFTDWLIF
jgi:hypothetical protein